MSVQNIKCRIIAGTNGTLVILYEKLNKKCRIKMLFCLLNFYEHFLMYYFVVSIFPFNCSSLVMFLECTIDLTKLRK